MPKSATAPSFAMLVQRFFAEHLTHHRAVSPRTVAAYGDTFLLLLQFAERHVATSLCALPSDGALDIEQRTDPL